MADATAMEAPAGHHTALLAAMADGIGDLCFAAEDWVDAAAQALAAAAARHSAGLAGLGRFTLCEVAHNAPAWRHAGSKLAWHARFDNASVQVAGGELPDAECDLKIEGDHGIMSNLARLRHQGRNPAVVAAAQARLTRLSRWRTRGALPAQTALRVVLATLHDDMAARTLPRFVFMTPEWVSSARHILTERAASAKYADAVRDVSYTFAEEFVETPRYAFPDGAHGGFWVAAEHGRVTVGAGPLPADRQPADSLTRGSYGRVIPVGRTVEAALTDAERTAKDGYSKLAFSPPAGSKALPVTQSSPSGKGRMPKSLMRVFAVLHDELSKRTSGELPVDYEPGETAAWAQPQPFDRQPGYDPSWLRYDEFDIYGQPR